MRGNGAEIHVTQGHVTTYIPTYVCVEMVLRVMSHRVMSPLTSLHIYAMFDAYSYIRHEYQEDSFHPV